MRSQSCPESWFPPGEKLSLVFYDMEGKHWEMVRSASLTTGMGSIFSQAHCASNFSFYGDVTVRPEKARGPIFEDPIV